MLTSALSAPNHAATTGYVQLDGIFYTFDRDLPVSYDAFGRVLTLSSASMLNCQRPSGSAPAVGTMAIFYGAGFGVLYTSADMQFSQTAPHIRITTPTGNVTCAGSVAAPTITLFAAGFE